MTKIYKVCPICEARNHRNAALCATCGATIAEVAPRQDNAEDEALSEAYDYRYGETDLAESSLGVRGRVASAFLLVLIIVIAGVAAFIVFAPQMQESDAVVSFQHATDHVTRIAGPSVTPGTPTATFTASPPPTAAPTLRPSPAPCVRKVAEGDSLIAIITRCGHGSLAILPTVMALNEISDEDHVRIGQEIVVPYPSPTDDPTTAADSKTSASAADTDDQLERLAFDPFAPTLTPTLLPGLTWHVVQTDEDMIYIAAVYRTNVKLLSDLNPEIDFLLCDFSEVYGGPECTVQLSVNQHIRVPAPTPTLTLVPTASGRETPTPRPTATFNAPIAQSPANEAYFSPFDQVTLRWVSTGRLAADEFYRIDFTNMDTGERFQADTIELFLIVPAEWQSPDAESHRYSWKVSVFDTGTNATSYMTAPRTFVWQGTGKSET